VYGEEYGIYAEEVGAGDVGIYSPDFVQANGYKSFRDSYFWVPANQAVPTYYSIGDITISNRPNGSIQVTKNSGSGSEGVMIPIALPGVLFGQNVDVEQIRIYYDLSSASSYITNTWLNKQTGASTQDVIVTDPTNRTSTSDTSYILTPSPTGLDSSAGSLNLHLEFIFANSTDVITIGAIRIRLGHTD
jgi:hypothetical protein